jgi:hypothetical protein
MRILGLSVVALLLFAVAAIKADQGKPNLSGTWKIDPARSQLDRTTKDLVFIIEEKGQQIHVKEIRGPHPQDDVSEFTCGTMGRDCAMQDGKEKANVSVYYNGPLLVILKTHGRKDSVAEKQRLSLSPAGDSLTVEVMPIEPEGRPEKLVLSKAR